MTTIADDGVMAMPVRVTGVGVSPLLPPPQPVSIRVATRSRLVPSLPGVVLNRLLKKYIPNSPA